VDCADNVESEVRPPILSGCGGKVTLWIGGA
jgi:hypothetical protein